MTTASQHRKIAFWRARSGQARAAAMLARTHRELRHTTRHRHALTAALRP